MGDSVRPSTKGTTTIRFPKFAAGAAVIAAGLLAAPAGAVTTPCSTDQTNSFTGASGCAIGSDKNPGELKVNSDEFFSFSDWKFIAKDNDLNGTDEGVLSALTIKNTVVKDNKPKETIGGT
jgi:hypothetical protein